MVNTKNIGMKIENVSFLVETEGIFSDFLDLIMTLFHMLCDVSYFDLSDPLYVWTGFQIHLNTIWLHLSINAILDYKIPRVTV